MNKNPSENDCKELLKNAFERLGRYPKRSDFSENEVMLIKAHLGPWPRALEKAGIKPERSDGFEAKKVQKRINSKIKKRNYKLNKEVKGNEN